MDSIRKIIHIDMDCFFAAIEMRENPHFAGKPLAVGGSPDQRGVLTTCNYEARRFGLHSAMSSRQALQRCPNLILLPVNMPLYREVSAQIHQIFRRYTEIIEPLSLDEAYLDVTDCTQCCGSATWIAKEIREAIQAELHLTASAGVAPLKFLAKLASDQNKPNGQFVIEPGEVQNFIKNLPLAKIHGVGKVTAAKLAALGLHTCLDLQQADQTLIYRQFGKFGRQLWAFCHGIDPRRVEPNRVRKSLAVENTLLDDIDDIAIATDFVKKQYRLLCYRLERQGLAGVKVKKIGLKLKFDDFTQTTLERTSLEMSEEGFLTLLPQIWSRRGTRKIRLIGLHLTLPTISSDNEVRQLSLWQENKENP